MFANAGVAYDYFFKEHPRYFFGWLKLSTKGAQHWGRLSESALIVSKNISKVAGLCQYGYDIPYAFQSFKEVFEQYRGLPSTGPSAQTPIWVEACRAVNSAVFITGFGKSHIFGQPSSVLAETIESVADLVVNGYGLYIFVSQWQEPQSLKEKQVASSCDTPKIVLLVQKISNFVLVGLALFSLYKGVDEFLPNLTIFFTTTSLSSHFIYYCNAEVSKNAK